jgi:hypothetical protein
MLKITPNERVYRQALAAHVIEQNKNGSPTPQPVQKF